MAHPPPDAQRDAPGCARDHPRPLVRARCATYLARERSRLRSSTLVAGEPTLEIATHLIPWHRLARGDNLGVSPLGRILELRPAIFLFGFLSYRLQNETVRGGSSPFCCASDALLEILRQANGGCGHREVPCEKPTVAQLCYLDIPPPGSVMRVNFCAFSWPNNLLKRAPTPLIGGPKIGKVWRTSCLDRKGSVTNPFVQGQARRRSGGRG